MVEVGALDSLIDSGDSLDRITRLASACNEIEVCGNELVRLTSDPRTELQTLIDDELTKEQKFTERIDKKIANLESSIGIVHKPVEKPPTPISTDDKLDTESASPPPHSSTDPKADLDISLTEMISREEPAGKSESIGELITIPLSENKCDLEGHPFQWPSKISDIGSEKDLKDLKL